MDQNTLLSGYYEQKLPQVSEDSLRYKELLFHEGQINQSWRPRGDLDLSKSFIIENETVIPGAASQPKKATVPAQGQNIKQAGNQPQAQVNAKPVVTKNVRGNWRQNAMENNTSAKDDSTVEFFKGGVIANKSEVEDFVRGTSSKNGKKSFNADNTFNNEINETSQNRNFNDTMEEPSSQTKDSKIILGNMSESDINSSQYNDYFNKSNVHMPPGMNRAFPYPVQMPFAPMIPIQMIPNMPGAMGTIPNMGNVPNIPNMINPTPTEKVKIENIFNFNDKIQFPVDQPLWYLSLPWSMMLIGPVSSNALVEMYNKRAVDSNYGLKPIDVFYFKHVSGNGSKNEVVSLSYLNNDNWAEDIQDSPLLQYTELYITTKKLFDNNVVNSNVNVKQTISTASANNSSNNTKKKENVAPAKKETEKVREKEEPKSHTVKYAANRETLRLIQTKIQTKPDDTLQLTAIEIKRNFMDETEIEPEEAPKTKNDFNNYIQIAREIDEEDDQWEKVDKKKKKAKDNDPSFYLIGNKPKQETKKEYKSTQRVEIVPAEELVKDLMPKHLREENKPNYKAFNPTADNEGFTPANKKKKMKGKPQDLNVKLGFKI
jgi:hypothetical protein